MMLWIIAVACVAGFVLPLALSYLRCQRPLARRGQARLSLLVPIAAGAAIATVLLPMLAWHRPPGILGYITLAAGYATLVLWWLFTDRPPSDYEAQINYALESDLCGRCGYNLTGNTSGVCPECGWQIPSVPSLPDDPTWGLFWKKWEISRLAQPGKRLAICLAGVIGAIIMGLLPLILARRLFPSLILICIIFFALTGFGLINAWRIFAYIRRGPRVQSSDASVRPTETSNPGN